MFNIMKDFMDSTDLEVIGHCVIPMTTDNISLFRDDTHRDAYGEVVNWLIVASVEDETDMITIWAVDIDGMSAYDTPFLSWGGSHIAFTDAILIGIKGKFIDGE